MASVAAWIFFVLLSAVVLFVSGSKTAQLAQDKDDLLDALARLVTAIEKHPKEISDHVASETEYCREVVEAYDEGNLTGLADT